MTKPLALPVASLHDSVENWRLYLKTDSDNCPRGVRCGLKVQQQRDGKNMQHLVGTRIVGAVDVLVHITDFQQPGFA